MPVYLYCDIQIPNPQEDTMPQVKNLNFVRDAGALTICMIPNAANI